VMVVQNHVGCRYGTIIVVDRAAAIIRGDTEALSEVSVVVARVIGRATTAGRLEATRRLLGARSNSPMRLQLTLGQQSLGWPGPEPSGG
jgi:hypothetical protein